MVKRVLSLCLLLTVLLTGCRTVPAPQTAPTEATEPETTSAAVTMDAESLFWKMRFVAGGKRANKFVREESLNMRVGAGGMYVRTQSKSSAEVLIQLEPFAINVAQTGEAKTMDLEIEQNTQSYYRIENGKPVLYQYYEEYEQWIRQELDVEPSEILWTYSVTGCPSKLPPDLALADKTQTVDGKEAYVLTYSLKGTEYLADSKDPEIKQMLEQLQVETTFYVDTETYMPLKQVFTMKDLSKEQSALVLSVVGGAVLPLESGQSIEISEYTRVVTQVDYNAVEVPDIPKEGKESSEQIADV